MKIRFGLEIFVNLWWWCVLLYAMRLPTFSHRRIIWKEKVGELVGPATGGIGIKIQKRSFGFVKQVTSKCLSTFYVIFPRTLPNVLG